MKTLKIGQAVYTNINGKGTIISINGTKSVVDFNGTQKIMLNMLLKTKEASKKVKSYMKEDIEIKETFNSIVSKIEGSNRSSMFGFADIFSEIEKKAFDSKTGESELAGKIVEDARNHKNISKKQAQIVACFAKANGLI